MQLSQSLHSINAHLPSPLLIDEPWTQCGHIYIQQNYPTANFCQHNIFSVDR